jgi:hypothetical protein
MRVYVYHFDAEKVCKDHPLAFLTGEGPVFPTDYKLVAYVESNESGRAALEDAFGRTNHIDTDWQENDGVLSIGKSNRSTSVGDVIFVQDDDDDAKDVETGHYYLCKTTGWQEIDAPLYPLDVANYTLNEPYYPDKSNMSQGVTEINVSMIGPDAFEFFDQDGEHIPPTFYGALPLLQDILAFLQDTE